MIPVKHIDPEDLPLYAMHLLPDEESGEMRENLQHSVEARRVLADVYGDLSLLAISADTQVPSPLSRQRLIKQLTRERKAIPIDIGAPATSRPISLAEEPPARRGTAVPILPWIGWALAAGMILPALNFYRQQQQQRRELDQLKTTLSASRSQLQQTQVSAEFATTLMETVKDPAAVHVTLTSSELRPSPQGRASYLPAKGALVFLASNLESIQTYKVYELWLIPADGTNAIPAGTFRPDAKGNASIVLPSLPKGVEAKAFGVTIEDTEGSNTPTAPILLKGAAS